MDIYMESLGAIQEPALVIAKMRAKKDNRFRCKICKYKTDRKSSFDKHTLTAKHIRKVANLQNEANVAQKVAIKTREDVSIRYECPFCSKFFRSRGGKNKHIKKCSNNPHIKDKVKFLEKQLELEKERNKKLEEKLGEHEHEKVKLENKYLKKHVDVLKNNKGNTQNINTQNNNYFNIQVYLDEKCKNAMPIMDFIKDLQFKLTDINPERPASTIESLSKCITDKLEDMDETERPVHCSDAKRLVFHVKDASGWTKDVNNKKIDKAIGWANMRHQGAWIKKATSEDLASQKNDLDFLHMNVAMGKYSDDPTKAKKKIKRAIAKAVPIKKS